MSPICADCGQDHADLGTIQARLRTYNRRFWFFAILWIISILGVVAGAFWAFGYGGGLLAFAWFLSDFAKVNTAAMDEVRQAYRNAESKAHKLPVLLPGESKPTLGGTYL